MKTIKGGEEDLTGKYHSIKLQPHGIFLMLTDPGDHRRRRRRRKGRRRKIRRKRRSKSNLANDATYIAPV